MVTWIKAIKDSTYGCNFFRSTETFSSFLDPEVCDELDQEKEKLYSADDRESREKSHRASDQTELPFELDLDITNYTRKKQ